MCGCMCVHQIEALLGPPPLPPRLHCMIAQKSGYHAIDFRGLHRRAGIISSITTAASVN